MTNAIRGHGAVCRNSIALAKAGSCPSQRWLDATTRLLSSDVTLVNIGANKGYVVNELLQRFRAGWRVTNAEWCMHINAFVKPGSVRTQCGHGPLCGACTDCRVPPPTVTVPRTVQAAQQPWPRIIAVELADANAQLLRHLFGKLAVPAEVMHAGGSNTTEGYAIDPDVPVGHEMGMLQLAGVGSRTTGRVPLVTADHVAESRGLDNITFLTIDTEGHDSLVLLGARQLLSARRVRVLQFEYHERGLWAKTPLSPRVRWLHRNGYTCFWQSKTGPLSPFLPRCSYDFKRWSNVVCAHEPAIVSAFEALVPQQLRGSGARERQGERPPRARMHDGWASRGGRG